MEMIVGIALVIIAVLEIALFTRTAAANTPR